MLYLFNCLFPRIRKKLELLLQGLTHCEDKGLFLYVNGPIVGMALRECDAVIQRVTFRFNRLITNLPSSPSSLFCRSTSTSRRCLTPRCRTSTRWGRSTASSSSSTNSRRTTMRPGEELAKRRLCGMWLFHDKPLHTEERARPQA